MVGTVDAWAGMNCEIGLFWGYNIVMIDCCLINDVSIYKNDFANVIYTSQSLKSDLWDVILSKL